MSAHTSHRDTLAGCAPINSDWASQFASVVIVSMLVLFCSFCNSVQYKFPPKTHFKRETAVNENL